RAGGGIVVVSIDKTETGFEENIERALMASGFQQRKLKGPALAKFQKWAIDQEILFSFLEATQPKALERLHKVYKDEYQSKIMERLDKELKRRGIINCLRHG